MIEPKPFLRSVILEEVFVSPVDVHGADAEPLRDSTGNEVRQEDGRVIYV